MRILVVNPFGIGDVLFSLPLVRAVRAAAPEAFIGYFCNRRTEELVACWPELDWHHSFEKDEFRRLWKESRAKGFRFLSRTLNAVREKRFDLLVDLSLGWHAGFAGLLCRIPVRVGFNYRGRGRFLTGILPLKGFSRPVAEHDLDLLRLIGFPRPEGRISWRMNLPDGTEGKAREHLRALGLESAPFAVIVPGGGTSWGPNARFKQWPPERFARAADHLRKRHRLEILLSGDDREQALCGEVAQQMSEPPKGILHVSSLLLLAGLFKRSRLVLGNDGGALHLAEAAGAPAVSIFGPVDPAVYGPPPGESAHRAVAKMLACRPCYQQFRFPPCPWDNACLKQLEPEPVLQAVDEILR